jgi:hypothetical protein
MVTVISILVRAKDDGGHLAFGRTWSVINSSNPFSGFNEKRLFSFVFGLVVCISVFIN